MLVVTWYVLDTRTFGSVYLEMGLLAVREILWKSLNRQTRVLF